MSKKIEDQEKAEIAEGLIRFRDNVAEGSSNKASRLLGISNAYVSNMINGKWDNISDDMWRKVQKQTANPTKKNWSLVTTRVTKFCHQLFDDAREHSLCYGMIGAAGSGKDVAIRTYAMNHENFWYINCQRYFNQVTFLREVCVAMGMGDDALPAHDLMSKIKEKALKADKTTIVINEADKLNDTVLLNFVTFFNYLEDECGLIIIATEHLERKVLRGVTTNKMGFRELYSRIGRKFVRIPIPDKSDVGLICRANGIDDDMKITEIYNDDPTVTDIRRVKRLIHKEKKQGGKS